jgi:peptide/nickel transport system substrate-binding protein
VNSGERASTHEHPSLVGRRQFLQLAGTTAGLVAVGCLPNLPTRSDIGPPLVQTGGTVRLGIAGDLPVADPLAPGTLNQVLCGLIYNRLLRPRAGSSVPYDSGDVIEDLAEKWEQTDEVTHVFYLRRGVHWHDLPPVAGRELTSEDVKATLERLAALRGNAPSPALAAIERVDLPDRYTVKVTVREPMPALISAVAAPQARIVPAELLEREGELRRLAVGSGPFFLGKPPANGRLLLRKNPTYFRPSQPYLDGVEIILVPDRAAELALLKARETDLGLEPAGLLPAEAEAVRAANSEVVLVRIQRPAVVLLGFNVARPPFHDVRLRQAASLALDRRRLATETYGDHFLLSGHLPPSLVEWALAPEEVERHWGKRDLARARALLADVLGVDPSAAAELTLLVHPTADLPPLAELVAEQLREAGFRLRLLRPEPGVLPRLASERAFDLLLVQPPPSTEPEEWTSTLYAASSPRNLWGYNDRRFEELLLRSRRAPEKEGRRRALLDLQRYLADKLPATPLFSPVHEYALASSLKGWAPHWSAGLPGLEEAWVYRPPESTPGRGGR